jgi:hypothetical protein
VLGTAAVIGLARMLEGTFVGVITSDPVVFVASPAVLAAAATMAIWLPTRRASATDATIAMRA